MAGDTAACWSAAHRALEAGDWHTVGLNEPVTCSFWCRDPASYCGPPLGRASWRGFPGASLFHQTTPGVELLLPKRQQARHFPGHPVPRLSGGRRARENWMVRTTRTPTSHRLGTPRPRLRQPATPQTPPRAAAATRASHRGGTCLPATRQPTVGRKPHFLPTL